MDPKCSETLRTLRGHVSPLRGVLTRNGPAGPLADVAWWGLVGVSTRAALGVGHKSMRNVSLKGAKRREKRVKGGLHIAT